MAELRKTVSEQQPPRVAFSMNVIAGPITAAERGVPEGSVVETRQGMALPGESMHQIIERTRGGS